MKDNEIDRILEKLNPQDIERRTKYVIAQKQMVEHELKVNYMIRQEPSDPWDSGWRFFHGNETAEMIERSDEFFDCYNPSEILYKGNEAIKKYLSLLSVHVLVVKMMTLFLKTTVNPKNQTSRRL